ncbi:TonB-dependent receptor [Pedobacter sp. MR2016-24]|uniref:TonB-dependent receptor n=1 Tax=Pedobacter sp. MR2016-24 TaxID=2994466 RepID=UPI0022486677|nr:TonB-dependent receptor [Pedobacter sp. MR2016-24]MCX2484749.1 TonB-dependent receptor [Pedobacter sp. MR2016-24]
MKKIYEKTSLRVLCVLGFLILSLGANAQSIIKGKVTDSQKNLLPGVSVLPPTGSGTVTSAKGEFSLTLPDGTYAITFSMVGYNKVIRTVVLKGETVVLDVLLDDSGNQLNEVVVSTGSRASKRTLTDSPVPIDIIGSADLKSTGQLTFDKALQSKVPSFNTVNTPVNDATSLLDPYEIRNMGPSRTLILINGKRKNSSALTYVQTSPGRGESGADISAIPTDAIKRVEILRDGASAQYGSDAIAGVMNIILKDRFEYGSVTLNSGITHKGDGEMVGVSVNNGANFGDKGYVNYTIDLQHTNMANRPGIVDATGDANDFGADLSTVQAFLAQFPDAKNVNASPENASAKFLINGGIPINENTEFYYNAAYIYKRVNSFANYRTPYWRATDFGLLHEAGTPYLGYGPTFEGDLKDYNATAGFRSTTNGWKTDVSFTTGGNNQLYAVNNTVNTGLGAGSPISFKPGGFDFKNNIGNIDISKALTEKLNIALGSEFRQESFTIIAGDTASYGSGGADSFPGYGENLAITATRYNIGGYADVSFDITKQFLINATARVEKYSDFGNAFVWKASSRYKMLDDKLTLRSSISTGFRAPSLQQINLQLAQASFVPGSGIQTKGLVNNNSPQSRLLGVPKLKAEKSLNFTAGLGITPADNFNVTLDFYSIRVKNRIVLSSEIGPGGTPESAGLDQVLADNGIVAVSFFVNGIDTRTQGLDFVSSYRNIQVGTGVLGLSLAGNYTFQNKSLKIINPALIASAGQTVVDDTQLALLLSSRPKYKGIAGGDYRVGKLTVNLNNTLIGPTTFHQAGINENLNTEFSTKILTDLGGSFAITKKVSLSVNAQNIFNVLPEWKYKSLNAAGDAVLNDAAQVKNITNALTFNGRYATTTYDGSQFSQLGATFVASLNVKF